MKFFKYQALGNTYIILPDVLPAILKPDFIARICDAHYGLGSDGVLVPQPGRSLRIFNPDGSEAEKSGNGLRIFARYLFDQGLVQAESEFVVQTKSGPAACCVQGSGQVVVNMGRVSFFSRDIPVAGPERSVIAETIHLGSHSLQITALTVGNPHCVIFVDSVSPDLARSLGPLVETHPLFPQRTNVQFVRVEDQNQLILEIWERGAGYTLASGSSACAAAAAAIHHGLCRPPVSVKMPGGQLTVDLDPDNCLILLGPAERIAWGEVF